jgi:hypothetical protein
VPLTPEGVEVIVTLAAEPVTVFPFESSSRTKTGLSVIPAVAFAGGCVVNANSTAGGGVPVPVRVAVWGEPEALSATESVAEKLVADAGVNVT